ncbi:hypothetical protein AXX17_AT3G33630 [Arabidopsis thaliana]|uniref:Uncharacterized protein n=1 Tax=Arabidopsis thaliana TaxID=3702 RepID=A0A178V9I0_ARATH|nr:hypothetical protein AXX17_AT3G33630 [Arabidopsis thaliana]
MEEHEEKEIWFMSIRRSEMKQILVKSESGQSKENRRREKRKEEEQFQEDVHGTTIYIFNGGITFLTEPYGVRFWLMENQGGAQEYAVKALIVS